MKSDQGTEYKNDIIKQIAKILKFKQTFATAYHPQTMGSLERNRRCLNGYLRSFSNEHHDDWMNGLNFTHSLTTQQTTQIHNLRLMNYYSEEKLTYLKIF